MKTPFTVEQFLHVFKNYNLTVFPMQIIFYILAATVIYFAIKKNAISDKVINLILSFLWLWMGVVYHIIYFSVINKAAILFCSVFITGVLTIAFSLIFYPVLGFFIGHVYPSSPTFGLPCPTTIFTFGLLLWLDKKIPFTILVNCRFLCCLFTWNL